MAGSWWDRHFRSVHSLAGVQARPPTPTDAGKTQTRPAAPFVGRAEPASGGCLSVAFCWADKAVLRRIREQVAEAASGLAVYFALAEIASDNQADEFSATQQAVAAKSGLSVRTVADRIRDLAGAGVISADVPTLRAPTRFRLLSMIGNGCRTLGNGCRALGSGTANPLPNTNRRINNQPQGSPLATADRIGLEKQAEQLGAEVQRLAGLRLHQRNADWEETLAAKRRDLADINRRLGESAAAIARR